MAGDLVIHVNDSIQPRGLWGGWDEVKHVPGLAQRPAPSHHAINASYLKNDRYYYPKGAPIGADTSLGRGGSHILAWVAAAPLSGRGVFLGIMNTLRSKELLYNYTLIQMPSYLDPSVYVRGNRSQSLRKKKSQKKKDKKEKNV